MSLKKAMPILLLVVALAMFAIPAPTQSAKNVVYVTHVEGMIHGGVTSQLEMSLEQALQAGAEALLIQLDTPGGLLDSTRDIVQLLLNADIPVFVYVSPSGAHAGSAGVMLTMAAHVAAMAPGTNIGAATPVSSQGEIPETMKKKVTNDTAAFVEAIAQKRKRNTEWAIKAVRDAEAITDKKALELNVIDYVAGSVDELLTQADGKVVDVNGTQTTLATAGATVVEVQLGWKQRAKIGFANPQLAFGLLLLAILGIYVEFSHPGLIVPGALGALCGILFLFSIQVLPFNYLGLLLIALGILCFALEMKFTSYGMLTIAGLACMTFGGVLLFDVPEKMFDPRAAAGFRVPLGLILPSTITMGAFILAVMYAVIRAQRGKVLTMDEGMVGELGVMKADLARGQIGQVFLHGEYWRAIADEDLLAGDSVQVTACENLTVRIKKG